LLALLLLLLLLLFLLLLPHVLTDFLTLLPFPLCVYLQTYSSSVDPFHAPEDRGSDITHTPIRVQYQLLQFHQQQLHHQHVQQADFAPQDFFGFPADPHSSLFYSETAGTVLENLPEDSVGSEDDLSSSLSADSPSFYPVDSAPSVVPTATASSSSPSPVPSASVYHHYPAASRRHIVVLKPRKRHAEDEVDSSSEDEDAKSDPDYTEVSSSSSTVKRRRLSVLPPPTQAQIAATAAEQAAYAMRLVNEMLPTKSQKRRGPIPTYILHAESIAKQALHRARMLVDGPSSPEAETSADKKRDGRRRQACANCGTQNTSLWRRGTNQESLCNACGLYLKLHQVMRPIELKTDVVKKRNRSEYRTKDKEVSFGKKKGSRGGAADTTDSAGLRM